MSNYRHIQNFIFNQPLSNIKIFEEKFYIQIKNGNIVQINDKGKIIKSLNIETSVFIIHNEIIYYSNLSNYKLEIKNLRTNQILAIFNKHIGRINDLVLDKKNNKLYSSSCDKTLRIWDIKSFTLIETINFKYRVYDLNLRNDLLYVALEHKEIKVFKLNTFENLYDLMCSDHIGNIQISNDSKYLYEISCNYDFYNTINIWNIKNQDIVKTIRHKNIKHCTSLVYNNLLFMGITYLGNSYFKSHYQILVYELTNYKLIDTIFTDKTFVKNISIFNNKLYTSKNDNVIDVWDIDYSLKLNKKCFNLLSKEKRKIISTLCLIKEKYDYLEYGLPPELWSYIFQFLRTYEL